MKIFSATFLVAIVATTVERCTRVFLLVQVDDTTGRGNICFNIIYRSEMRNDFLNSKL